MHPRCTTLAPTLPMVVDVPASGQLVKCDIQYADMHLRWSELT